MVSLYSKGHTRENKKKQMPIFTVWMYLFCFCIFRQQFTVKLQMRLNCDQTEIRRGYIVFVGETVVVCMVSCGFINLQLLLWVCPPNLSAPVCSWILSIMRTIEFIFSLFFDVTLNSNWSGWKSKKPTASHSWGQQITKEEFLQ